MNKKYKVTMEAIDGTGITIQLYAMAQFEAIQHGGVSSPKEQQIILTVIKEPNPSDFEYLHTEK